MNDEQLAIFHGQGFVILKDFLPTEAVEGARAAAAKLTQHFSQHLASNGKVPGENAFCDEPLSKRFMKLCENNTAEIPVLWRKELHIPEMWPLLGCERVLEAAHQIVEGSELRIFPNYSMRPKLPHTGKHDVAWHQDAGLLPDGSPNREPAGERMHDFGPQAMVNCWAPLVPATVQTGCMKMVPGTHKLGCVQHSIVGLYDAALNAHKLKPGEEASGTAPPGTYNTTIDPAVISKYEADAIDAECNPGDIILFSNLLFHRGGFNTSDIVRWSVDWRYQDASKPTHRPDQGHVLRIRKKETPENRAVFGFAEPAAVAASSPEEWASLCLS